MAGNRLTKKYQKAPERPPEDQRQKRDRVTEGAKLQKFVQFVHAGKSADKISFQLPTA